MSSTAKSDSNQNNNNDDDDDTKKPPAEKSNDDDILREHNRIRLGLQQLVTSLKTLDDKKHDTMISHYKNIPHSISQAYLLMEEGSSLIHGTSTKYTLMGKISQEEQVKIARDLLRGCQVLGTGILLIFENSCSRSAKCHVKQIGCDIVRSVLQLVECDHEHHKNERAQRTGAVWDACDRLKFVPRGNRNAMRRDVMTWMKEAQETLHEFQEMMDNEEEEDNYSVPELPLAEACLGLIKNSRGSLNLCLKAMEVVGEQIIEDDAKKWLAGIHESARKVGEGLTDLGAQLYPPLELDSLRDEITRQSTSLEELQGFVLESCFEFPVEVKSLGRRLSNAAGTRKQEALAALQACL